MQELGDLRERIRALEVSAAHQQQTMATLSDWCNGTHGSIGRLAGRVAEVERRTASLGDVVERQRRAEVWIEGRDARERQRETAKADSKRAREDAIKVVYAAAMLAGLLAYLVGWIDGEKFKALSSVLAPGK